MEGEITYHSKMVTKTKIFGMPLIALGMKERGFISIGMYARGFIAIGWVGKGFITIAQFGFGAIAFTQFGFGIISVSQFGFGAVSMAQFGLGLILAVGQGVLGFIANGLNAKGYYALSGPGVFGRFPELYSIVMADPLPFYIWSGAWAAVFAFLWSQRDKFALGMAAGDLFRNRRRHRVDRIRARAVSAITDQEELLNIVMKDPSDTVKMAALKNIADPSAMALIAKSTMSEEVAGYVIGKIDDRETLLDIARSAATAAVKIGAVSRIARSDPDRLVELACSEKDPQVIQEIINPIKNRASLEKIIHSAAAPQAKIAAINNIGKPDHEFLFGIVKAEKDAAVSKAAVSLINAPDILAEIVRGDYDSAVKKAAVERIEDKKVLRELADAGVPDDIREAIKRRLKAIRPQYYSLKVEISCPFCSQPVFVNGPAKKAKCQSCLRDTGLPGPLWEKIARSDFGTIEYMDQLSLIVEKAGIKAPLCNSCGASLDTDDIETGARTMPPCPSCKTSQSTFPLPEWLPWSQNAEQVFCADEEGVPSPPIKGIKPVAISCIKCGAPLEITVETPRNATCQYCNTVQYLPDPLWLSLHPVKIKQAWYVRCNYRERAGREA
ncbi:MAG: hypothetical protein KA369_19365 [Spirochaetes bacterium]|nr:hypothetical protein [Spirochaetota bacterium]